MNSPKKNFVYNCVYQLLILIIPLITAPYLSRVVGADGVGIYSYTYSIVYYFMLLTLLGVNNYGNRTIAKVRDCKKELSRNFFEIYIFQFVTGIIMLMLYLGYVFIFVTEYKIVAIIQSIFIISSILDINWLFFGLEEFKKTITKNTIVKILSIILIFIFVKNQEDLWKYVAIISGMTCLGQILLWKYAVSFLEKINIKELNVFKHIKPNFMLFLPVIAVSLYKIMDKIMLGSIKNVIEVGYYENAEKIINVPLALIGALGNVMLPRVSNLISKGNYDKGREYIYKSMKFIMFLSFAMMAGIIAVGKRFAPIFFGVGFERTGDLICLLAITIPFVSFASIIRTQYLIPTEDDKTFVISSFMGAIINFIMNAFFIPKYGCIGACYGTISAEFLVMVYQTFAVKSKLPIKEYLKDASIFFIKSIFMLIIISFLNYLPINSMLIIMLQIVIGIFIYFLSNINYILSIIDIKKILLHFKEI